VSAAEKLPPSATATRRARLARPMGAQGHQGKPRGKVMVAIPCFGGQMTASTANSVMNLLCSFMLSHVPFEKCFPANESLITRGRNLCVKRFLDSDCTHLLFIDADVGFRTRDVGTLLDAEVDVVVGAYPKKVIGWHIVAEAAKQGCPPEELARQGAIFASNVVPGPDGEVDVVMRNGHRYVEVHDANTGFMLITRACLERYVEAFRADIEYQVDPDALTGKVETMWNVFHAGILGGTPGVPPRYLSEDYWFCRKWQELGGKIWLSLDTDLTHSGYHTFTGDIGRMLMPVDDDNRDPGAADGPPLAVDVEMVAPGD
jgi:hypothetical protein